MAIVRNKGYVQLRRGLFEHVQNGEMSIGECFLYTAILANADPATGIWISSAGMLSSFYSIPGRTCKDWLAKLEEKRYLRRFRVQGKHGQYPIFVHKFQCTEGALKGMRLNAWKSESCASPKYEPCPDACTESAPAGALTVPQSTREEEKKRKNTKAPASPSLFVFPDWVPREPWEAWLEVRRQKGAKNTNHALTLAVKELEKLRAAGEDPAKVLDESTLRSWTGLFPVKSKNSSTNGMTPVSAYPPGFFDGSPREVRNV